MERKYLHSGILAAGLVILGMASFFMSKEVMPTIDQPEEATEAITNAFTGVYTGESYEELGDLNIAPGATYEFTDSCITDHLEVAASANVSAPYPIVVFFSESNTVENGMRIGNVQFVSDYDEVVAIVHTNDTHGFLQSEPYVKGLKNQLADSGLYSLVLAVNAGDQYAGGNAAAHIYEGEYIPYIQSKVYDYITWGNNDAGLTARGIQTYFLATLGNATGVTTLLSNQHASQDIDLSAYAKKYIPALGAEEFVSLYPNALSLKEDGSIDYTNLHLSAYTIQTDGSVLQDSELVTTSFGSKIGIFGVSTQGGSITEDYFIGGEDTLQVSQKVTSDLISRGAGLVIELGHIGWMGEGSTETSANDTNSYQVATNVTGLDVLIDGHSHSIINDGEGFLADGEGKAFVNQASCKGQAIGVCYIYLKDGHVVGIDGEVFNCDENGAIPGVTPDEEVSAAVEHVKERLVADGYTKVYTSSDTFLNGERSSSENAGGSVRANETNLGDLVADCTLWAANRVSEEGGISAALYPGFWIRASIEAGDITLADTLSVFANELKVYEKEYTASEFCELIQAGISKVGEDSTTFYQVAGITVTYNKSMQTPTTITVGDTMIYDRGNILVGDDWTIKVAGVVTGDFDLPTGATLLIPDNKTMAQYLADYLASGEASIYRNTIAPDGRISEYK